jgi:hypothetical protein
VREQVELLEHHADLLADGLDGLDVVAELDAVDDERPCWCSSSRLMQRISVLLPEPDGPQITMRSPLATVRSMSRSTWKLLPYHLLTLSKLMMALFGHGSWRSGGPALPAGFVFMVTVLAA